VLNAGILSGLGGAQLYKFLQLATAYLLQCSKNTRTIITKLAFCSHRLSPPPSEKVDLPQVARLGAFFCRIKLPKILFLKFFDV
jgi:hypothetical protein